MKAHINGITVEGTPQEIMEYRQLCEERAEKKADEWFKTAHSPNLFMPKVTCERTLTISSSELNGGSIKW